MAEQTSGEPVASPVIYVPVALSELEAVAVKSACVAVITSAAPLLSRDHPLISGALKIEDAWRKAKEKPPGVGEEDNHGA